MTWTLSRANYLITRCAIAETVLMVFFLLVSVSSILFPRHDTWNRVGFVITGSAGALVPIVAAVMWVTAVYIVSVDKAIPDGKKRTWILMLFVFNLLAAYVFGMQRLRRSTAAN